MPIYTYKCPECGNKRDILQKLNDPAPRCYHHGGSWDQGIEMRKQLTAPGFEIRGGGVYSPGVKPR